MFRKLFRGWGRVVLALLVALALSPGDLPPRGDLITEAASPFRYSLVGWELSKFPEKWLRIARQNFPFASRSKSDDRVDFLLSYFQRNADLQDAKARLERVASGLPGEPEAELRRKVQDFQRQQDKDRPNMEADIEAIITGVLTEERLDIPMGIGRLVWPPVDFRPTTPPKVLIVSPRERIEIARDVLLRPGLDLSDAERLESEIQSSGMSALVEDTGGLAAYPSMVPDFYDLRGTIATAAHEWTHHYLIFHPLGRQYWSNDIMRTINETVADTVGGEVADRIMRRYFTLPASASPAPSPRAGGEVVAYASAVLPQEEFSFNGEMRLPRLHVDELLAAGQVSEAEQYMEERRRFLADHGYFIRKLNQAYFAFHGAYADTPASSSRAGPDIQGLRRKSASLGDFLRKASGIRSPADLDRLLKEGT